MPGFNDMALLPQGFLVQTPGWKLGFSTSGRATGAMTWSQDTLEDGHIHHLGYVG